MDDSTLRMDAIILSGQIKHLLFSTDAFCAEYDRLGCEWTDRELMLLCSCLSSTVRDLKCILEKFRAQGGIKKMKDCQCDRSINGVKEFVMETDEVGKMFCPVNDV